MSVIRSQPAYVLHRQPLETDQERVELLTPDLGRMQFRRKIDKRSLPLFQQLDVDFRGQGASHQLRSWVPSGPIHHLQNHRLYFGLYLNELIARLWPKQGNSVALFGLYSSTLTLISQQHKELAALRYFERILLAELGFALEFKQTVDGKAVDPDAQYGHCVGEGFRKDNGTLGAISGAHLMAIDRNEWDLPGALHHARRIFSLEIDLHLNGQTLHTRDLLRQVLQSSSGLSGVKK